MRSRFSVKIVFHVFLIVCLPTQKEVHSVMMLLKYSMTEGDSLKAEQ